MNDGIIEYFENGCINDYYCSNCFGVATAKQKISLTTAPKTLCVVLNRFAPKTQTSKSVANDEVQFKKLMNKIRNDE